MSRYALRVIPDERRRSVKNTQFDIENGYRKILGRNSATFPVYPVGRNGGHAQSYSWDFVD